MQKPRFRFDGFADDWEERKLGEVVDFLDTQRRPLEGAKRVAGPYPYYGASGIVDYVADYLFDEELVLLSEDGANITDRNYPICFLASGKYWVNNHAHVLKVKTENENNFICNSLERKNYTRYNTGMAMPKLNQETCKNIPVMCPEFGEQKRIGDYFRSLDHLITLQQCKYKAVKELKKNMLQKLFPRNESKNPEIRFNGFIDDWEQRKLGEVCSRVQGNDGRMELPTLTISAGNGWMRQEDRFSSNIAGKEQKNYTLLRKGELSYNHGNSKLAKYGTVFSLQIYEEALVPRVYHSFKVIKGNADFIEYYFATKLPDKELGKLISSGARMDGLLNISFDEFMGIPLMFPSTAEQTRIAIYFRHLDHLITLQQRKVDELKKLKAAMLKNLFI